MTRPSPTPTPLDPIEATVAEIHEAMTEGGLTAEALVETYLARIEEYDEDLNAILTLNDDARARARRLDGRFEDGGFVGPLHGVPVVLKDNHDTHDMPTTAGSAALSDSRPSRDAAVVERLRSAGAVVLAKANLQELSFGVDTVSSLGGETRNAYDLRRRPSGSSGGTAAAIAANLGAVGTGSDTCSSVRSPPAFNALVGVRPTRGLVSRRGIVPLSETQDTAGPIARTVGDAARLLEVMAGYDPEDPVTARGERRVPPEGYAAGLGEADLEGVRVGVARQFFGARDDDRAAEAERVTAVLEDAIGTMADAGATVVDPIEVVAPDRLESARVVAHEFARDFGRYLSELGEDAPHGSLAEVVATGEIDPAVESRIEAAGALDIDPDALEESVDYLKRLRRREELRDRTLSRLIDEDLDAVLYPPSTVPPVEIPEHQPFGEMNCELAAHTGLPAVVVPAGFTDGGLPVGVELLGRAFDERRLLEIAAAIEGTIEGRRPPRRFGPLE